MIEAESMNFPLQMRNDGVLLSCREEKYYNS